MSGKDNRSCVIYALRDPLTKQIRYVGLSSNLPQRLDLHINRAKSFDPDKPRYGSNPGLHEWLKSLLRKGVKPEALIIDEVPVGSNRYKVEARWIEHYLLLGEPLTNITWSSGREPGSGFVIIDTTTGEQELAG
jgi:hypothetical protein